MPARMFHLNRDSSQVITISQEDAGTPITISLNDCIVGTLPPPEKRRTGRTFKIAGGSTLTVRIVDQQMLVWHHGLPP